jgi:hypothetical protein
LAVYIAVVFIGGALLAPWLYWLAQSFAHEFPTLARHPFHRYVHRSFLLLALLGIWPLLKSMGATSLQEAGLVSPFGQWSKLGYGFLLGLVSLAIVAGLALASGARHFKPMLPPAQLGGKFLGIGLSAVAVAVLEELLFRGAVFGSLRKVFHWCFALVVSSLIYAIVHFLEPAQLTGAVTWYSGLELLPRMLRGFVNLSALIPGFFNLTLAGALLALAYQRTGNLYFSIGLHGGWIVWLKSYRLLMEEVAGTSLWWWGTSELINGWFALAVLTATLLIFIQLPVGRKQGYHT